VKDRGGTAESRIQRTRGLVHAEPARHNEADGDRNDAVVALEHVHTSLARTHACGDGRAETGQLGEQRLTPRCQLLQISEGLQRRLENVTGHTPMSDSGVSQLARRSAGAPSEVGRTGREITVSGACGQHFPRCPIEKGVFTR